MPLTRIDATTALACLEEFDTIVDARSESEYTEDHLPGAVNWPSLTDQQRQAVGEQYKQDSAFEASKRGAALVARNIAAHIEREVTTRPKGWRPLVYCWRGGKRSGALALVLDQIGFRVCVLEGGYREFRRAVVAALAALPSTLELHVVCGTTGSGKSRLLGELARRGEQVLDLEALANHRGSVLGLLPGEVQPGQKCFETLLWDRLRALDPKRRTWVESESRKIGELHLPEALIERMRASPCVRLELPLPARVTFLLDEYRHYVDDVPAFCERLDALRAQRGNAVVDAWQREARAGRVAGVVGELLVAHYDPVYLQSMQRNFAQSGNPGAVLSWDGSAPGLGNAAQQLIEGS